ncbi:uncharacterized protein V2V93DRAFT_376042 [Kockiozyma suomiensis]|uniref:uncharacterized protein n=1 Tax=Kockiozyma suomiensis TaxID=1337062 RepID=UPI00334349EC
MTTASSKKERELENRAGLHDAAARGFVKGALVGALYGGFAAFTMYKLSPRYSKSSVSMRSYIFLAFVTVGGVIEQNRQAKRYVYNYMWEEKVGCPPPVDDRRSQREDRITQFTERLKRELRDRHGK